MIQPQPHPPAAQAQQQILQAAGVAQADGATGQQLLPALRAGIFDAQHLPAAEIDSRQALKHIVHRLDAEGQAELLTAQPRPPLEIANAVLVEGHVGDGNGGHGVSPFA
ncbi:MAG: hypothetical protein V9H69_21205 [Anaerolineae bacterium]